MSAEQHPGRNVGTECVATAILMVCGPGLVVLGEGRVDPLAVAVAFGVASALAIGVIGALANPVLSLAMFVVRRISLRDATFDWIGQILGGLLGAAVVWGLNDTTRVSVGSNGWDRDGFAALGTVIAAEVVFTVVIVVVFLSALARDTSTATVAVATGAAYGTAHLVLLGISGGGINPARSIGSAVFADADPAPLAQVAVFVVVPLVAAVAAVFVWLAIDDAEVDDTVFDDTFLDRD